MRTTVRSSERTPLTRGCEFPHRLLALCYQWLRQVLEAHVPVDVTDGKPEQRHGQEMQAPS
jgi:hypothetical protein